jgi:Ca2+-binding RTX toxin-like protein
MATVTIQGGQGSDTIAFAFTVTGTNTTAYANAFATDVNKILTTGTFTTLPGTGGTQAIALSQGAQADQVYVLANPTVTDESYNIPTGGYVLDTISGGVTINLDTAAGGSDTVWVAAIHADATVVGGGGSNNQVTFVDGNNVFIGTADLGGDTVVGGSGFDTIYTSEAGSTTVNSGTGSATIYLQDSTASSSAGAVSINDYVWLNDGTNTIYANGVGDAVISSVGDQTIWGAGGSPQSGVVDPGNGTGYLGVVLQSSSNGDLINAANSATVAAFDYGNNTSIIGGTGDLYFIGGDSVTASVDGGAGNAYLFGADGDNLTLGAGSTGSAYFVAGLGNETLDGAASTGTLYAFGGSDTAGSDSITGGSGFNALTAGAGSETLTGGSGTNYFQISEATAPGSNITINDFLGGNSTLILDGANSQADAQAIYSATSDDPAGNLVVTISDSTTITFTGITSGSQLQGHIVTF